MRIKSGRYISLLLGVLILIAAFPCFAEGQQDSQTMDHAPGYSDNGDGTVSDNASGLMWARDDSARIMSREEAQKYAEQSMLAGYDDWRVPTAKEMQHIEAYIRDKPASGSSVFNFTKPAEPVDGAAAGKPGGEPAAERGNTYVRLVRGGEPGAGEGPGSQERRGGPEGNHDGPRPEGDASGRSQGGPPAPPDFASAAAKLGIGEDQLMDALGDPRQGPPDFAAAAQALDITEEELLTALDVPEMPEGGRLPGK